MLKISLPQQSNAGFDPKVKGVYFQGSPVKFFSQVSEFLPQVPLFFLLTPLSCLPPHCIIQLWNTILIWWIYWEWVSLRWIHQKRLKKKLTEWKVRITNRGTGKILKKDALIKWWPFGREFWVQFPGFEDGEGSEWAAQDVHTNSWWMQTSKIGSAGWAGGYWDERGKQNLKCTVRKDGAFQKHSDTNSSFANAFLTWDKDATYPNRTRITQKN